MHLTIKDIEQETHSKLPRDYRYHFNEGAGDMVRLNDNEKAFGRYKLHPRDLRDVAEVDSTTEIFKTKVSMPLGFAPGPAAAHRFAHENAERRTSRAAANNGIAMCLSTWSTTSTVYTAEDVQLAIEKGVDCVVISNHGGRQLNGQPATPDALRDCAPVAQGKIPLAIDGGIQSSADIFKAIALGASMCFIGRIPIWGLAYNGEAGVDLALKILLEFILR
ncbi:hypothetical protein LTS12_027581 [Elasticomyces elasticus]|nr:hypothetical protein LTS12_027581 [Elasticomyces elasticus]